MSIDTTDTAEHDFYVARVNALVAAGRDDDARDLAAESTGSASDGTVATQCVSR
jgi:hypothetical protein